jgi:fatty acid desaturase
MSCSLEKYKNLFGKPNEGAHSLRIPILDIALIDFLLTGFVASIITLILYFIGINNIYWYWLFLIIFVILILLGIIVHDIFCVKTKINKLLSKK